MRPTKPAARDHATTGTEPDPERLTRLRELAATSPDQARAQGWAWLHELRAPSEHHRLPWLFAQGTAPEGPEGDCEGTVLWLHGKAWLTGLDRLVRLGRRLGGVGWSGKTFDQASGTGYNRLTASARIPALLALPTYPFRRRGGELLGFRFYHRLDDSPLPPHPRVRSVIYDAPEHANPLVLPRTRDELVEISPEVYLGRALLRDGGEWRVVGYFGLRQPREER